MTDRAGISEPRKIYVTMNGLPLSFHLEWPFRKSTSGADFFVLHADIRLENSEGLHAPVAVNLSATVREVMPSLEAKDVEEPMINALRKEVDRRQIEFVKSGKLVPVSFSSRHYDFKRGKWVFGQASDAEIELLLVTKDLLADATGGWKSMDRRSDRGLVRGNFVRAYSRHRQETGNARSDSAGK